MIVHRVRGIPPRAVLDEAAACVASSGTLIFPTETVYGIGCAAADERGITRIYELKRRDEGKPLAIHIATSDDALAFAQTLRPAARALMETLWPGPISIIVTRRPERAAAAARHGPTIALRCPDDDVARAIIRATGPLAATSANISGQRAYRGDENDIGSLPQATMAIIAGPTRERRESTVLDCAGSTVRILREGAVSAERIRRALEGVAALEP